MPWQMPGTHHEQCRAPSLGWGMTAMEETINCYNNPSCSKGASQQILFNLWERNRYKRRIKSTEESYHSLALCVCVYTRVCMSMLWEAESRTLHILKISTTELHSQSHAMTFHNLPEYAHEYSEVYYL